MTETKGIVYLSGPISDSCNGYNEDFHIARMLVEKAGYTPVGPDFLPPGLKESDYMRIAFSILEAADMVVALKGWTKSQGAQLEWAYAKRTGKPCMTLARFCEECRVLADPAELGGRKT